MTRWEHQQARELLEAMAEHELISDAVERETERHLEMGNVSTALRLLTRYE